LWFVRAKWGRAIFFAAAYYVISLFPVLGFFSVYFFRYSFVSDHFQYLASMGPLALAGAGIAAVGGRLCQTPLELASGKDAPQLSENESVAARTKLFLACALGVLLVLLSFLTWRQTAEYRNLIALYTATLKKNPGCWMAHYNLGIVFSEEGETDQAIDHYRQAVALRPDYAEAHYNLGRLLVEQGHLDDAIAHYQKVVEINPADAEAENNLGVTFFGIGRADDAIVHYQKALEIQPDYAEASCNLANALIAKGDIDDAIARYTTCLAAMPDQVEAQYNLASALLRKGRTADAIVRYQKVIELNPDNPDPHANLGSALLTEGRVRDAIAEYRKALCEKRIGGCHTRRARRRGKFQERKSHDYSSDLGCRLRRGGSLCRGERDCTTGTAIRQCSRQFGVGRLTSGRDCALRIGFAVPQTRKVAASIEVLRPSQ